MKKLLFLLIFFPLITYAINCPRIVRLKEVGLSSNVVQDNNGRWYAGRTSQNYETPEQWTFVIGDIGARDKVEALQEAQEALETLSFHSGPFKGPADKWICLYDNSEGFPAAAVTPPITEFPEIKGIK
jgi:hypothetical protein